MKYRQIYEEGVETLKQAGIAEAGLDARVLLEFVCGTDRNTLLAHPDLEVPEEKYNSYVNCLKKRAKRIPLQHLTETQCFMGLDFYVNQNVLIPRQDTEILVEEAMKHIHDGMHILDMCTGSGCILISLLQYSNHCAGVGADLSDKALEVAVKNAEAILSQKDMKICENVFYPASDEVHFVQSNLFENFSSEKFDVIVSNPPYIASEVIAGLEPEVAEHEPRMALDGMEDGLFFYRKIVEKSREHLFGGGMLFFEIGYDQGEAVSSLMRKAGFTDVEVKKDYAGLDRVVFGTLLEEKHV